VISSAKNEHGAEQSAPFLRRWTRETEFSTASTSEFSIIKPWSVPYYLTGNSAQKPRNRKHPRRMAAA